MPRAKAKKRKPRKASAKPKKAPAQLAPEVQLEEPGRITYVYIPTSQTSGVYVTEHKAMTYAAVWACIKVISEDIASLPWRVMRERPGGGADFVSNNSVDWILHRAANPEMPAYYFKETIVAHALSWGNGYAEIERNLRGEPVWLWLITPDRVEVVRDDLGRLVYDVHNPGGPNTVLYANDMFHLRGLGFDGLVGYSVISMAARVVGKGIAMDTHGSEFFANDCTPAGILTHPKTLTPQAKASLRADFERRHKGKRVFAIFEEGMDWKDVSMSHEDSEFIESSHLTIEDVCRFFRVQPHKIMHLLRSTNNNIEHQDTEYGRDTLTPWVNRLESEANIKLFGRTQQGNLFTKLNMKARLRGDTAAQTAFLKSMLTSGVYSVDQALEYLDENPIGTAQGGDKRLVQINLTTLEKIGEEPPAPPPSADMPPDDEEEEPDDEEVDDEEDDEEEDEGEGMEEMQSACLPAITDACRRILGREYHRVTKIMSRAESREEWLAGFIPQHASFIKSALTEAIKPLSVFAKCPANVLGVLIESEVATATQSFSERARKPETAEEWQANAESWAKALSDAVIRLGRLPK